MAYITGDTAPADGAGEIPQGLVIAVRKCREIPQGRIYRVVATLAEEGGSVLDLQRLAQVLE